MKSRKPYETNNFGEDLEIVNQVGSRDLIEFSNSTSGRETSPFGFSFAKIDNLMELHAEIEKKSWGGSREGAGRKRKGVHYYGFRATQEVHDILSKVEGSKADYINHCILLAQSLLQEH